MTEMLELRELKCQNCGAHIDRNSLKCPYCGTQYERKYNGVPIVYDTDRPGVHKISAMVKVDDDFIARSPERATQYSLDRLRQGIAEGLLDYMKLCTTQEYDHMQMCQIIRAEVRVVDPKFSY
jgi:RNA polymerase subunit RPABC4/transcription elongation factor Spt4